MRLIYSTEDEIYSSDLRLNNTENRLVFAQKVGGTDDSNLEIFYVGIDGSGLKRLTDNDVLDVYPVWSPDGKRIAFLSKRENDLDIYMMDSEGGNVVMQYDSGFSDGDIDWAGDTIVFTSQFSIWKMDSDGTGATQVTDFAGKGEWGNANLPKGDHDPRLSRDGRKIVFERLEDNSSANGGYNLFSVNIDGTEETRLTDNNYSQGIATWSHSGGQLAYVVAAMAGQGKYDIYVINSDGTNNRNIIPSYFPPDFLCYSPIFSGDDSRILFIGQWWAAK